MENFDQRTKLKDKIRLVTLNGNKSEIVRVMMCQIDFDQMHYEKGNRLFFVKNDFYNQTYLRTFVDIAVKQNVDLLIFPELSIPKEFVDYILGCAKENDMLIVAGTHYKEVRGGYVSICPIVTSEGIFETHKLTPAPAEQSAFGQGVLPGEIFFCFRGSKIGDFAVLICLDYTNFELRSLIDKDNLDFMIVTAFNSKSNEFFYSMHADVQGSRDGSYVLYANALSRQYGGEGKSALFGIMDNSFKEEFIQNKVTDQEPPNKLFEFSDQHSYCIFDVNIRQKRPYLGKNIYSSPNVKVVEQGFTDMDGRYKFLNMIGASEDRYKLIHELYVKPKEYDEMMDILDKEGILIITGDPGIGKTYTAIHILYHYFEQGYRPIWWYGLAKEDRELQKDYLQNFEPQEKQIVYLEDPFGRIEFENREELKTLFSNMLEKFKANHAKLIITSRQEVFKKFKNEILTADKLEAFRQEMNVRKPSYRHGDLITIAKNVVAKFSDWKNGDELMHLVEWGVENDLLISPLMIFNLVMNHSRTPSPKLIEDAIRQARTVDLDTQFADEIKTLAKPSKILLYLVLLYAKKSTSQYREMFDRVQYVLISKTPFEGSTFDYEMRNQDGHRIQRLGIQIPVYRFSHPSYEEALVRLVENNQECYQIVDTCLSEILKDDSSVSVEIFKRFLVRYPQLMELFVRSIKQEVFDKFSEDDKLELTRKMILSGRDTFVTIARKTYPIQLLIQNCELNDMNIRLFIRRLRSLRSRQNEIGALPLKWKEVFNHDKIVAMNAQQFMMCCNLALDIDPEVVFKIGPNLDKYDMIKKFVVLPDEKSMQELNMLLSDTYLSGLYFDLKKIIPEDILTNRNNNDQYNKILRKYILRKKHVSGSIIIDDGAMKAMKRFAKLYPVGILDVYGSFSEGDVVKVISKNQKETVWMKTVVEMSSSDIIRYKGLHSPEIYEMEGEIITTVVSRARFRLIEKKKRRNIC